MSGDSTVSAFPDGDNLFSWVAQITGGSGTMYEGLQYKLSLSFPSRYPYTPPTVKFVTPCYHPNVDTHGNICLDILKEKWSALYDVRTILLSIQSLLAEPNNESPLNVEAADTWEDQAGKVYYLLSFMISAPPYLQSGNLHDSRLVIYMTSHTSSLVICITPGS